MKKLFLAFTIFLILVGIQILSLISWKSANVDSGLRFEPPYVLYLSPRVVFDSSFNSDFFSEEVSSLEKSARQIIYDACIHAGKENFLVEVFTDDSLVKTYSVRKNIKEWPIVEDVSYQGGKKYNLYSNDAIISSFIIHENEEGSILIESFNFEGKKIGSLSIKKTGDNIVALLDETAQKVKRVVNIIGKDTVSLSQSLTDYYTGETQKRIVFYNDKGLKALDSVVADNDAFLLSFDKTMFVEKRQYDDSGRIIQMTSEIAHYNRQLPFLLFPLKSSYTEKEEISFFYDNNFLTEVIFTSEFRLCDGVVKSQKRALIKNNF